MIRIDHIQQLGIALDEVEPSIDAPEAFDEDIESRLTPTRQELMAIALDEDVDDPILPPRGMDSNDAFRIIELIKEREALMRSR